MIIHIIQNQFLFPWVIRRENLDTRIDANSLMKRLIESRKRHFQSDTLMQTYNGTNLLLMTPLIKYDVENYVFFILICII